MRAFTLGWVGVPMLAVCCASAWAAPASAPATGPAVAPATRPADAQSIARLIRDLSSDDFQARTAAEGQIVLFGDAAEAALREVVSTSADPEAVTRARRALGRIEENRNIGPTVVTLKFTNAPAGQVFHELARQARTPLTTVPENFFEQNSIRPVTIDLDHCTFWEAVRELTKKTGITTQIRWDKCNNAMLLYIDGENLASQPAHLSGPIALVVQSVSRSETVQFSPPRSTSRNLSVNIKAMFEPRLCAMFGNGPVNLGLTIDEAATAAGDSLLTDSSRNLSVGASNDGFVCFSFEFRCPDAPGGRLRKLRGELRYDVPVRTDTLEIPDLGLAQSVSKTIGTRKFEVLSVAERDQQMFVQVRIERGDASDQEWRQMNTHLVPQLLDSEGRALEFRGCSLRQSDANSVTGTCTFTNQNQGNAGRVAKPAKLIWLVPLETQSVTLPFEFKDIPLP